MCGSPRTSIRLTESSPEGLVDDRRHQVIEMRFFAGMSEDEIAEMLGVSTRTINREWRMARAWLYKEVYG